MGRVLGVFASLFILLLAGYSQPSAHASALDCVTSQESCGFYQCLEHEKNCGSKGYPLEFGERLCERYREAQPSSSYPLRHWYPRVRECLQQAVAVIADPLSCGDLEKQAFESHLECYMETGFCDLSFSDKLAVLRVAGADSLYPKTMAVSLRIAATCAQWKSVLPATSRLQLVKDVHHDIDGLVDGPLLNSH